MAKIFELLSANYVEVKAIAGADLAAGDFVALNDINGFALVDVLNGAQYSLIANCEKAKVDKIAGTAWVAGEAVYYVNATSDVSTAGDVLIGHAYEAAASGDTSGIIVFDGSLAFAKAV